MTTVQITKAAKHRSDPRQWAEVCLAIAPAAKMRVTSSADIHRSELFTLDGLAHPFAAAESAAFSGVLFALRQAQPRYAPGGQEAIVELRRLVGHVDQWSNGIFAYLAGAAIQEALGLETSCSASCPEWEMGTIEA